MTKYIYIHGYSNKLYYIFASIIKLKTNSKVNHVSIEIPKVGIYQALSRNGVTKTKTHYAKPIVSVKLPFNTQSFAGKEFIQYLDELVNKKTSYDFIGVLLGFFGIKIQNKKKFFCSELADLYFSRYLSKKSFVYTNLSPKEVLLKAESFYNGYCHGSKK